MKKISNIAIILLSITWLPTTVIADRGTMNQDPVALVGVVDTQVPVVDTDNTDDQENPNIYAAAGGAAVGAGLTGLGAMTILNAEKVRAIKREIKREQPDITDTEKELLSADPEVRAKANKKLDRSKLYNDASTKKALRDKVNASIKPTVKERVTGRIDKTAYVNRIA